ncbi:MAG: hypothetical protein M1561_06535 [Gammaproteobacteria bacterium]|nr:hypothetical protein [Gammaproteobacteria bacterium]
MTTEQKAQNAEQKQFDKIKHFAEKITQLNETISELKSDEAKAEYEKIKNGYLELSLIVALDYIEMLQESAASAPDSEKRRRFSQILATQAIISKLAKPPSAVTDVFHPEILKRLKLSYIYKKMNIYVG